MTDTFTVVIIESDRLVSAKIGKAGEFNTEEEAKAFCEAFNAQYETEASTPTYYRIARYYAERKFSL